MHNALKPLVALALIGAGGTALAGVAYLQANPLALTTPRLSQSRAAEASPAAGWSVYSLYLPVTLPVAQLPDRRTGALPVAKHGKPALGAQAQAAGVTEPRRLVPCSDWMDMGPASLSLDSGQQRRRVMMLCPEGAPVSDYYDRNQ